MDLSVPAVTLAALLLGTARAAGFVLLAPPFNSRTIPAPVKGAFALALAVLLSTQIAPTLPEPTAGFLVVAAVTEVVIGAALGFVVQVLFQAATQIQEQTLSFVPKIIAVAIALLVTGNWVLAELVSFTQSLFDQLPALLDRT